MNKQPSKQLRRPMLRIRRHNLNQMASGKPGAVQTLRRAIFYARFIVMAAAVYVCGIAFYCSTLVTLGMRKSPSLA